MTAASVSLGDNSLDDHVDVEIASYVDPSNPKSFFLFAGAGSGKTRSLISALAYISDVHGEKMMQRGQRVGVITYTNAACDEIKSRRQFDPLIHVVTVHSFAWSLIGGFNRDIREWLRTNLAYDISELQAAEAKGRKNTKASDKRLVDIASKTKRLTRLDDIKKFTYSPTGDNRSRDALNHAEVIKITADFLTNKPTLQKILVNAFPILLIDESQDTNKHLVDALFAVQASFRQSFCLGLLGDMMQRIYNDGKEKLGEDLPIGWMTPTKQMNHRCPKRVVELINKIRINVDKQVQRPRSDSVEGIVRFYIFPSDTANKNAVEQAVAIKMADISGDKLWENANNIKCLTLEHRMAARRMGFSDLFVPLHGIESYRTGLLDGSLPIIAFYSSNVLPLVQAFANKDKFLIARIVREKSPLLTSLKLEQSTSPSGLLKQAQSAVESLMALWEGGALPTFKAILDNISQSGLFAIPDSLLSSLQPLQDAPPANAEDEDADPQSEVAIAISEFLAGSFSQLERYVEYVSGAARFDTHQGIKGREFPRVMVIMDDSEARGFLFNFDKLFGDVHADDKTAQATKRLLYVTCSRAEESLVLVGYSGNPEMVKANVVREGWFRPEEVQLEIS
ncbi:UvrD-helicase domain-containing protein [Neorhizobium galegae]|uniref:UvrD-helicase domain-containing protein n=1 Tax=Neorhizobium galegae TaxID=399 RepID=UPI001F241A01|nr:UvrD-helicase domain-containing protein [Neorhizobium galegae]UIK04816.1 UvrD-helicase domain-containing protein [Neorhizobium galegae]